MREIKFRIYIQDEKRQILKRDYSYEDIFNGKAKEELSEEGFYKLARFQFTGLLDKNGKEIYEGDIITNNINRDVVEWIKCDACFSTKDYMPFLIDACNWSKCKVIGNIYENPELI